MSWQHEDEENANNDEEQPADWNEKEDSDEWRHKAQEEIDAEVEPLSSNNDDIGSHELQRDIATKTKTPALARSVSIHYNLESTEPLNPSDAKWIAIKSIILWIYLVVISSGIVNNSSNSPQSIWIIAYIILLIVWCLFFRLTAVSKQGGFYPLIGDWTQQIYHTTLFIFGLAGIDLYFLEKSRSVMRECLMQYKVVEFSVLWFAYFISLSWRQYPWSSYIEESYTNWSTDWDPLNWWELVNTIPILLLLMDSVVHYSKVYHHKLWNNMKFEKLQYLSALFVLYLDSVIRGLLVILFVRVSIVFILFVAAAYAVYLISIWMASLAKSGEVKQLGNALKKSGLFTR